jgi:deoxyribodipyrimidine photo-lyase
MPGTVEHLLAETRADLVVWNRRYDPAGLAADETLRAKLERQGVAHASFSGHLLHEPEGLRSSSGTPFRVYSPFWRALVAGGEPRRPLSPPKVLRGFAKAPAGEQLDDWKLLPTSPDWADTMAGIWEPGEGGAHRGLSYFIRNRLAGYARHRDMPGIEGTSRLSPHLAHGEITPAQIWWAVREEGTHAPGHDVETFLKELAWREFSWHLLFHNPRLATTNLDQRFNRMIWVKDRCALHRWQKGMTGYPIVDAGMRELWVTGWMHNRVRMIAASFLTKDLLIDWREGEAWFWDTLVDADAANNPASWQWVAGCGADAAPYFRIFNPLLQGEKFDPEGRYVRRWIPEIARLPDRFIHRPWEAPEETLAEAGVKLGETYPVAMVDHQKARRRALAAFEATREDA